MIDDDFTKLATRLDEKNLVGFESLSIWGGRCDPGRAKKLIEAWPAPETMPHGIWEFVSEIVFDTHLMPEGSIDMLERARIFGPGGDLSLRRHENRFLWWFVGPANSLPPAGFDEKDGNLEESEPNARFYRTEGQTCLLWGDLRHVGIAEEKDWRWFDDRVANADLRYPVGLDPEAGEKNMPGRVEIVFDEFSRAGRVEFVWFRSLRKHEEDDTEKKERENG